MYRGCIARVVIFVMILNIFTFNLFVDASTLTNGLNQILSVDFNSETSGKINFATTQDVQGSKWVFSNYDKSDACNTQIIVEDTDNVGNKYNVLTEKQGNEYKTSMYTKQTIDATLHSTVVYETKFRVQAGTGYVSLMFKNLNVSLGKELVRVYSPDLSGYADSNWHTFTCVQNMNMLTDAGLTSYVDGVAAKHPQKVHNVRPGDGDVLAKYNLVNTKINVWSNTTTPRGIEIYDVAVYGSGQVVTPTPTPSATVSPSASPNISPSPSPSPSVSPSPSPEVSQTPILQAGWEFDENQGSLINDDSGNNRNATLSGAEWVTGKTGSAVKFSGTAADITNATAFGLNDSFTYTAWVKPDETMASATGYLLGSTNAGAMAFSVASGIVRVDCINQWDYAIGSAVVPCDGSTWSHIAVTYDATTKIYKAYRNGVLLGQKLMGSGELLKTPTVGVPSNRMGERKQFSADSKFKGVIDSLHIYSTVLSLTQILEEAGEIPQPTPTPTPSPVTHYIDPTYVGTSDGTIEKPYRLWSDLTFKVGDTYLQKRGTTISTTLAISPKMNCTIGAYGTGERPIIKFSNERKAISISNVYGVTIRDLEIEAPDADCGINIANQAIYDILIDNCVVHNARWGIRMTGLTDDPWGGIKITNTEIYDTDDDGIFTQNVKNIEISYCYVHDVNRNYIKRGTDQELAAGDCIQFSGVIDGFNIHHNLIDHSARGNKFGIITNGDLKGTNKDIIEFNHIIGQRMGPDGGAGFYISRNAIYTNGPKIEIRNNIIENCFTVVHGNPSDIIFYNNILNNNDNGIFANKNAPFEIYNNTFYNSGVGINHYGSTLANVSLKSINNIFDITNEADTMCTVSTFAVNSDFLSNYNLISNEKAKFAMYSMTGYNTLVNWKQIGKDVNSIVGQPFFEDAPNGNFKLQSNSPAIGAGTAIIDSLGRNLTGDGAINIGANAELLYNTDISVNGSQKLKVTYPYSLRIKGFLPGYFQKDVSIDTKQIRIDFNNALNASPSNIGKVVIKDLTRNEIIPYTYSFENNNTTLVIPSYTLLNYSTTYEIMLDGTLTDAYGVQLQKTQSINFYTDKVKSVVWEAGLENLQAGTILNGSVDVNDVSYNANNSSVSNEVILDGADNKMLKMIHTANNQKTNNWIQKSFQVTDNKWLLFEVKSKFSSKTVNAMFQLTDTTSGAVYWEAQLPVAVMNTLNMNEWYDIKVQLDMVNGRIKYIIDGEKVVVNDNDPLKNATNLTLKLFAWAEGNATIASPQYLLVDYFDMFEFTDIQQPMSNWSLAKIKYTNTSGKIINSITDTQNLSVQAEVFKYKQTSENPVLGIAMYNFDGKLISIATRTKNDGSIKSLYKLKTDMVFQEGTVGNTVKALLFNDINTMQPIAKLTMFNGAPRPKPVLTNLLIDGVGISGFLPNTFNYKVKLSSSITTIPTVTAVGDYNIEVIKGASLTDTVIIVVRDKEFANNVSNYYVDFYVKPIAGLPQGMSEISIANASSTSVPDAAYNPSKTIDNDLTDESRWSSNVIGACIVYQFTGQVQIDKLSLYFLNGGTRVFDFIVETSVDGTNWSVVSKCASSGNTTGFETFTLNQSVGKYLRITNLGNSANTWMSIIEAKVLTKPM